MFSDRDLLGLPGGVVFHHRIQDCQPLAHAGDQGNSGRLANGSQGFDVMD